MCDLKGCGEQQYLPSIEIDPEQRRLFMKGLACLPLASVLAFPELSDAAASGLDTVSIKLPGGEEVSAALALPSATKAPAVILIHEWWGLNKYIKSVAAEFANLGYVALAVDLYNGKATKDSAEARALMKKVNAQEATSTLAQWNDWLRKHDRTTGKIGTVGWCFGGGWSLNASLAAPVDATIIYYGDVSVSADRLRSLQGPVMGHFATQDGWIDRGMVNGFEQQMKKAGKADILTVHWYEANHAFANPSSSRYDAEDAALSWDRTRQFFNSHLT